MEQSENTQKLNSAVKSLPEPQRGSHEESKQIALPVQGTAKAQLDGRTFLKI